MVICKRCSSSCDSTGFCLRCGIVAGFEDEVATWETVRKTQVTAESSSSLRCPRCRTTMRETHYVDLVLDECRACGGIWFDKGELARALEMLRAKSEELSGVVGNPGSDKGARDGAQLKCPRCGAPMSRCMFEGFSDVLVDRCERCGLWLDKGEIEKIFYYHAARGNPLRLQPAPWYAALLLGLRDLFKG